MENNSVSYEKIGCFKLTQPVIHCSDPCYDKESNGALRIQKCCVGKWNAYINTNHYEWIWDETPVTESRIASLFVQFDAAPTHLLNTIHFTQVGEKTVVSCLMKGWNKAGYISVDSGQAGFFDLEYYRKEDVLEDQQESESDDKWYSACCEASDTEHMADIVAHCGVNSSSGYGDGVYPVWYHCNDNGKTDAAVIFFLKENDQVKVKF